MKHPPALLVLGLTLSGGCTDAREPPPGVSIDTLESGTILVANDGSGVWDESTAWRVVEDLRLGSFDGGGAEQFTEIYYLLSDDDGRIYILDNLSQEIRVFEADGSFSHAIGSKGQGPGELESAAGLDWGPDGLLWVWSFRRFSAFEPAGRFVTSRARTPAGVIYPWIGGFDPAGRYIDWVLARERTGIVNGRATYAGNTTLYPVAFTPPNSFDTLPVLEWPSQITSNGHLMQNRGILNVSQSLDGHLWFAHSSEYRVHQRTLDGDTLLLFTKPAQAVRVPDVEIDSIIAADAQRGRTSKPDDFVPERRLVTRVLNDNAGHIYVFVHEPDVPDGSVVDVFEESGVFLGRVRFPEPIRTRSPPPHITASHIYAVIHDEFDVPYVVRYSIERPDAE